MTTPVRLQVLVAGPSAHTLGGMAGVQRLLERWAPDDVELHVYQTYADGGVATRLRMTITGVGGAVWSLLTRRTDVVHVHLSKRSSALRKGLILSVARARGIATVVHAHAGLFLDWFDGLPRPVQAVVRRLLVADRVIVLNEEVREGYARRLRVPPDRMVTMGNPVEWPGTVPARSANGRVDAVFLGAFREKKGIFDLVRAVALLPLPLREQLHLIAAGHGDPEPVRAAVRERGLTGSIQVSGYLSPVERDALLARAEILVLPSHAEGLPMSVLEAMAWGLAPVVTPVGGIPELIHDGDNGVIVPVGDPEALAAALGRLLHDGAARRAIGSRAREDVRVHAADAWAARLADLWRAVAAPNPTR